MAGVEREPTHRLVPGRELVVLPLDSGIGNPVQLTDRLVKQLEKAHEAVGKAEADIERWLRFTEQGGTT